jgi:hypothetical protein
MADMKPEEREKIFLEEKMRHEARKKLEIEEKNQKTKKGCLGCLGLIGFCLVVAFIIALSSKGDKNSVVAPMHGQARLHTPKTDSTLLGVTPEDLEKMIDAYNKGDKYGTGELALSGRTFFVKNNTKVLVIDSSVNYREVRILEGDQTGKAGWCPQEFVR